MLSAEQLHAVMPDLPEAKGQSFLPFLQAAIAEFAIEAAARCAAFLAQVAHESGQFRFMEEIWGPTAAQRRYEPPSSLATRLGNTQPGDGKRFKGRGPIQITGRANYRRFGDLLGLDLVADPGRAALPETAFRISGLFWARNGLNELADLATAEAFQTITRRINGGLNGLADRERFYAVARRVLGVPDAPAERGGALPVPSTGPLFERGAEAIRPFAGARDRTLAASAAKRLDSEDGGSPEAITFVVPGVRQEGATRGGVEIPHPPVGRLKDSAVLTAQRGPRDADVRLSARPGEDAVVIHIAGGPALWLHPEHARELLLAQHDPGSQDRAAEQPLEAGEVAVPPRLQWRLEDAVSSRGATRGFLGDVLVRAIDIVTGPIENEAADFAASTIVKRFDSHVTPGVYQLNASSLTSLKGKAPASIAATQAGTLVLIHGTFSDTAGTFGKLWTDYPQLVRALFGSYGDRVYALDHPTLAVSPIANAITLARAVPDGARLHLLTHSRGGLVAEVLARVAANPSDTFANFPTGDSGALREELRQLASIVASKRIRVDRVVRVACPARGTLLASNRLDAYVSVMKWALELAGLPVAPELVEFLGEVAKRRADPRLLPGLAAQIPDSPLIQWLHSVDAPIDGELRVVAGDLQGDSVVSWVKTLLADAFYWTDNDLVVQTRSMYGGSPRATDSTFMLDQGGRVSHFNYFSSPVTATAIVDALTRDTPAGFRVIGPLSWGGAASTGLRAALVPRSRAAAAELPAAFVLPGILGSNLKVDGNRVWLGWRMVNGFSRLAYDPARPDSVEPDGPIGLFYDDLATFLSEDHDVIPFAFDWRRPIEEEAHRLADAVEAALDARKQSGQPVRIIAHSMGGVVVRTMQVVRDGTWSRMMGIGGGRVLMLGTPNDGSWAPMQVMTGDDTFGNMLTLIGAPFRGSETRQLIAQFPGLVQLQAGLLGDLGRQATWQALEDADVAAARSGSTWHWLPQQLAQLQWGIPSQSVLDRAVSLRRNLDRQRDTDLGQFAGKLLVVVGKAPFTPAGFEMGSEGLVYLNASDQGDGRVPLQSALLPGVATWTLDAEHGAMPQAKEAFEAYRELLHNGDTKRLSRLSASHVSRGAAIRGSALVRSRPSRGLTTDPPPQRETEVLASTGRRAPEAPSTRTGPALSVTVVNGDLTYISEPLLIGHYRALKLTGAEAAMDRAIGGTMSASLQRGLYPAAPGTHQVFVNTSQPPDNPWLLPRPEAVIVAGLGAEGELRGSALVQTVRQAVIAWGQRLAERPGTPVVFPLAATLLGSGGSGITTGQAAQLIVQGVREANELLAGERDASHRWPRVSRLHITELYLDRATDAWRALQTLAAASPALYSIDPVIKSGTGALKRTPDAGYRGADYDFISAVMQTGKNQDERIVYTIDTKRARSEVRAQSAQVALLRNLVSTASNSRHADPQIGRTLFSLLVPVDLEPYMGSSMETVIQLDEGTAGIPWELLDNRTPGSGDTRPWAIRTKLLRKLQTAAFRTTGIDASADDSVLVIGDPGCDRSRYPRLFAARQEAAAVAAKLNASQADESDRTPNAPVVTALISALDGSGTDPDARIIINAAMARPWRIIHIAGHGEPPLAVDGRVDPRGVVLSDESFLGPAEIGALRVIPELVFVNCCHLATGDPSELFAAPNYDRARFASGVAEALIRVGVRCVVAAGWAVDDAAAQAFAETFYGQLLNGSRFIDAVAAARTEARACGGNSWAAYQCYGDPDWTYRRGTGDAQRPSAPPPSQEFAGIGSATSLTLQLERLAVQSEYQRSTGILQADRLRYLKDTFEHFWRTNGAVAEAFGNAWAKTGDLEEAIGWYEHARSAPDGSASLAAIEQLADLKARRAWELASSSKGRPSEAAQIARSQIAEALALLDTLTIMAPTLERESLYGSAYKRLALIEAEGGHPTRANEAIEKMRAHYAAAEKIGRAAAKGGEPEPGLFHAALNQLVAQLAIEQERGAAGLDAEILGVARRSMSTAAPEFWSVVGQTELQVYEYVAAGTLATNLESLTREFGDHHARVASPIKWASVYDSAMLVLSAYRRRAPAGEARAATELLASLAAHAGRPVGAPPADVARHSRKTVRARRLRTPAKAPTSRRRATR
jgi:predicted chitinase/tetratricopeptide (TPR) repeat protein